MKINCVATFIVALITGNAALAAGEEVPNSNEMGWGVVLDEQGYYTAQAPTELSIVNVMYPDRDTCLKVVQFGRDICPKKPGAYPWQHESEELMSPLEIVFLRQRAGVCQQYDIRFHDTSEQVQSATLSIEGRSVAQLEPEANDWYVPDDDRPPVYDGIRIEDSVTITAVQLVKEQLLEVEFMFPLNGSTVATTSAWDLCRAQKE